MSTFYFTMIEACIIIIGLLIGYFFNKANQEIWRIIAGFLIGVVASWLAGVGMWIYAALLNDPNVDIPLVTMDAIAEIPLFAIAGTIIGIYLGRRQAKLKDANKT